MSLLQAYVEGEAFKRKTTVKFAVVASPVAPAMPFAAFDGKKSDYFTALEKEDALITKGQWMTPARLALILILIRE